MPPRHEGALAAQLRVLPSPGPCLLQMLGSRQASAPRASILGSCPSTDTTATRLPVDLSPKAAQPSGTHERTAGTEVPGDEARSAQPGLCLAPARLSLVSISATALNPPPKALRKAKPAKHREGKQEIIYIHHKSQHTVTPCASALEGQE